MGVILSVLILILSMIIIKLNDLKSRKLLLVMAIFLLIYKSIEYTIYGLHLEVSKIPIEYSTITYFLFSICIIFEIKPLKSIVTFMGLISGLGYLIVFLFLYKEYIVHQGLYSTMIAYISHSICFLGSLILMKSKPAHKIEKRKIMLFTAIYVIYVILISKFIVNTNHSQIFILMLLDGDILKSIMGHQSVSSMDYLLYFLIVFIVYQNLINVFIWINKHFYKVEKGEKHEYTI